MLNKNSFTILWNIFDQEKELSISYKKILIPA